MITNKNYLIYLKYTNFTKYKSKISLVVYKKIFFELLFVEMKQPNEVDARMKIFLLSITDTIYGPGVFPCYVDSVEISSVVSGLQDEFC